MTSEQQTDPSGDAELSRLLSGLDTAEQELHRIEQRIATAERARDDAQERARALESELDTQRREFADALEAERRQADERADTQRGESTDALRAEFAETLEAERAEFAETLEGERAEFAQALQAERDDAGRVRESERAEFADALEAERTSSGKQSGDAADREKQLTDRIASLESSLADATSERDRRGEDLDATRTQLVEEAQERIAVDEQLGSLTARHTELQTGLETAERHLSELEAKVRAANEQHAGDRAAADDSLRRARDELAALQKRSGEQDDTHDRALRAKQDELDTALQRARFESNRADTAEKRADDAEHRADAAEPYGREMERALATADERHQRVVAEHESALAAARREAQTDQAKLERSVAELEERLVDAERRATAAETERDAAAAVRETRERRQRDTGGPDTGRPPTRARHRDGSDRETHSD